MGPTSRLLARAARVGQVPAADPPSHPTTLPLQHR